jgi:hypothetical protein
MMFRCALIIFYGLIWTEINDQMSAGGVWGAKFYRWMRNR